jgi:hypothetical protein
MRDIEWIDDLPTHLKNSIDDVSRRATLAPAEQASASLRNHWRWRVDHAAREKGSWTASSKPGAVQLNLNALEQVASARDERVLFSG